MTDAQTDTTPRPEYNTPRDGPVPQYVPLPEDIYGFAIYQLAVNWNELSSKDDKGISHKINSVLGICAGVFMLFANVALQMLLLLFTKFYIVEPSQGEMSVNLIGFHEKYGQVWNMEVMQDALAHHEPMAKVMCEMPSTDFRFLYIILLCWVVVVMQDIRSSIEFAVTLCGLPATKEGEMMIDLDDHSDGTVIDSVSLPVRIAVVILVALPKFLIGLLLLHYGCLWLMATSGFMDLVLNAVALAFIVEFGSLLFTTFLSASMQGKVTGTSFKYVSSGGRGSWTSIFVHAWDSHMSCVMMMGVSLGIVYFYANFQRHGGSPFPHSAEAQKVEVLGVDLSNQINIPCQRLVGHWWDTHTSSGHAYPWYNQYLDELASGGGGATKKRRGGKKRDSSGGGSGDGNAGDAPPLERDREESRQDHPPVAENAGVTPEEMKESDVIQDTIENPQNLMPKRFRDHGDEAIKEASGSLDRGATETTSEAHPSGSHATLSSIPDQVKDAKLQRTALGGASSAALPGEDDVLLLPRISGLQIADAPSPKFAQHAPPARSLRSARRHT